MRRDILETLYSKGFCYGDGQCSKENMTIHAVDTALAELDKCYKEVIDELKVN